MGLGAATHLWTPPTTGPPAPWEKEIDHLMRRQLVTLDPASASGDTTGAELVAENLPLIALVSPNVLVGAGPGLGNFRPPSSTPRPLERGRAVLGVAARRSLSSRHSGLNVRRIFRSSARSASNFGEPRRVLVLRTKPWPRAALWASNRTS